MTLYTDTVFQLVLATSDFRFAGAEKSAASKVSLGWEAPGCLQQPAYPAAATSFVRGPLVFLADTWWGSSRP